jgi:hypothetical protein
MMTHRSKGMVRRTFCLRKRNTSCYRSRMEIYPYNAGMCARNVLCGAYMLVWYSFVRIMLITREVDFYAGCLGQSWTSILAQNVGQILYLRRCMVQAAQKKNIYIYIVLLWHPSISLNLEWTAASQSHGFSRKTYVQITINALCVMWPDNIGSVVKTVCVIRSEIYR